MFTIYFNLIFCSKFVLYILIMPILVTGSLLHRSKLLISWLFLYPLGQLLYMEFWNTILELKNYRTQWRKSQNSTESYKCQLRWMQNTYCVLSTDTICCRLKQINYNEKRTLFIITCVNHGCYTATQLCYKYDLWQ